MKGVLVLGVCVAMCTSAALAQEPPTLPARTLAISGQPTTAPPGWALHAADAATTVAPASVEAHGPGIRITSPVALTLYRPKVPLMGDGTVGALVFVDATTPAIYGLTLGGENGLAFLMQPSGLAAIAPLRNGQVATAAWASAPSVSVPAAGSLQQCRIEVRVQGSNVTLLINGTVAATTTITPGTLDGVPGIYSGPGALSVVGLMIRTDAAHTAGRE